MSEDVCKKDLLRAVCDSGLLPYSSFARMPRFCDIFEVQLLHLFPYDEDFATLNYLDLPLLLAVQFGMSFADSPHPVLFW